MRFLTILILTLMFTLSVRADESFYTYPQNPKKPRNIMGRAILSFVVPGFDQWSEGQVGAGMAYTGLSVLGIGTAIAVRGDLTQSVSSKDDRSRATLLGLQTYQTMGSLSGYHAFRSGVIGRKTLGEYLFLTLEETPGDLAIAPLRFDYLVRPTTFVPLILLGGLIYLDATSGSNHAIPFSTADGVFASGFSYQAGLGEEALFRGVAQPLLMEIATDRRPFAANLVQAAVFGAAHLSSENSLPLIQFLFGLYLGWLTEHNQYTISENIFIHVWWDVLAIGASYAYQQKVNRPIYLPLVQLQF